jgi:SAM-dependent methyltransferase
MKLLHKLKLIINSIGMIYPRILCKFEYDRQKFSHLNERPIEFGFVFRQITKIWPKTVLDVGTGKTALPYMMRNCGLLVTAIDNIKDYWEFGMVNRHYHVINDDIKNSKLNKKFDLITCISVLEHIDDHRSAMKSMCKLLNPGGHLILTCPYNDNEYIPNVYDLEESNVNHKVSFVTQSFSSTERDSWTQDSEFSLVSDEYWQFFEGQFWTCGNLLSKPMLVSKNHKHQLCCMLFKKKDN